MPGLFSENWIHRHSASELNSCQKVTLLVLTASPLEKAHKNEHTIGCFCSLQARRRWKLKIVKTELKLNKTAVMTGLPRLSIVSFNTPSYKCIDIKMVHETFSGWATQNDSPNNEKGLRNLVTLWVDKQHHAHIGAWATETCHEKDYRWMNMFTKLCVARNLARNRQL